MVNNNGCYLQGLQYPVIEYLPLYDVFLQMKPADP